MLPAVAAASVASSNANASGKSRLNGQVLDCISNSFTSVRSAAIHAHRDSPQESVNSRRFLHNYL